MTRYVLCPRRGRLVPIDKAERRSAPVTRVESFGGADGNGLPVWQLDLHHPAIEAAGVHKNDKGRAIVRTAAERDRLIEKFNAYEEGRTGRRLVWNREMSDDE